MTSERLARQMGENPNLWEPRSLPAVLEYLPAGEPLALVRACDAAWIAVVQPQERGAVVVKSQVREPPVGTVMPVPHVVP
jgi:hypothetical protein